MDAILTTLGTGLPVLVVQLGLTLLLLAVGAACYMAITPFHEIGMIRAGNTAAGIVLGGTLVSLAMPLAATLATSRVTLDILIWGLVALVLQLLAFVAASAMIRDMRQAIENGNVSAAIALVGVQLAVALLNAGAMAG
jgi:putative membrane protein